MCVGVLVLVCVCVASPVWSGPVQARVCGGPERGVRGLGLQGQVQQEERHGGGLQRPGSLGWSNSSGPGWK